MTGDTERVSHDVVLEGLLVRAQGAPEGRTELLTALAARLGWSGDAAEAIAALGEVVDDDTLEYGYFTALSESGLTKTAEQWLFDPARVATLARGQRIDHTFVHNTEQIVQAQRRLSGALGGQMLPPVRESLRLVVALLQNSLYPEEVGGRLYAVAVELGRLAGWLAFDSDRSALARQYLLATLQAAHASGDRAAGADILGLMNVLAGPPAVEPG